MMRLHIHHMPGLIWLLQNDCQMGILDTTMHMKISGGGADTCLKSIQRLTGLWTGDMMEKTKTRPAL